MKLKAYNRKQLAKIDWIHYETVRYKVKKEEYVSICFTPAGKNKTERELFLSLADSEKIKEIVETYKKNNTSPF